MTTGIPPDPAAGEWLAEVLEQMGLPRSASAAEARVALLRHLPEQGFVPPLAWQQAVSWMLQPEQNALVTDEEVRQTKETAVREEVEKFAVEFFQFAVAERQPRWNELTERCHGLPSLYARLKALEAGLDISGELTDNREPKLHELSVWLRELFVLRPVERTRRRQACLQAVKDEPELWERAAQRVLRRHADWADLEPVLVDQLARWSSEKKRVARQRRRQSTAASGSPTGQRASPWLVYVLIGVAVSLVRLVSSGDSKPRSAPPLMPARQEYNGRDVARPWEGPQKQDQPLDPRVNDWLPEKGQQRRTPDELQRLREELIRDLERQLKQPPPPGPNQGPPR